MAKQGVADESKGAARSEPRSSLRSALMIAVAVIALVCIVFGSLPLKIVALVLGLCIIQGLWRGAGELVGIVAGMIFGVLLCRPIGRALEPTLSSLTSTSGLSSRLISVGLAALVVSTLVAIAISLLARKVLKKRPQLSGIDKLAGGGIGLLEGGFLGLIVLWVPLAMEPVARGQLSASPNGEVAPPNPVAEAVVRFAEEVKESSLGSVAESTNPMEGAKIFALTGDFALVMRHRKAREHFVHSEAMRTLSETPSFQEAIARLEKDPELGGMIRAGDYGPGFVRGVLTSKALLDVLDSTTVVKDLTPQVARIELALQEAKKIALDDR